MTKPREFKRYAHRQPELPMQTESFSPFVREDEKPIEISRVYVTALPTRPRTGIVRLCAAGYSQAFVMQTDVMLELVQSLVREGIRIEERYRRGA
jgi:hypothetical protein